MTTKKIGTEIRKEQIAQAKAELVANNEATAAFLVSA